MNEYKQIIAAISPPHILEDPEIQITNKDM